MKVLFVLWERDRRSREAREVALFVGALPAIRALREAGSCAVNGIALDLDDTHSRIPSPSPFPLFTDKPVGVLGVWLEELAAHGLITPILEAHGFEVAAYHVEQSVYTDYGGNAHSSPRDWPDGTRSPGVSAVTLFEKPSRLPYDEWQRRWFGRMSPVSEEIQPRQRYVRNRVLAVLTPGAPAFAGVVEEVFASGRHIRNPFLFYGAKNPWQLVVNLVRLLSAVTSFLTLWRIQTVVMSEHLLETPSDTGSPG